MSDQPTHWEIRHGETVLGTLTAYTWDFPWMDGDFQPAPGADDYRSLFTEELQPLVEDAEHTEDWTAWEAAYRKIEALGLRFVPVDAAARRLKDDLFEIAGDKLWFDAIFADE
jgi:hypothetical protein